VFGEMDERLGLNLHRDGWPTARSLAAREEAGLRWLQVHVPPRPMLADRGRCRRHARALRSVLHASSLRLVLHAPDDLSVGTSEHDRAFDGMLDYAAEVGAEIVAYHGMNFADAEGPARARIRERALLEERSLRGLLQRAHTLGVIVAVENLAPVHPAPPRLSHDALAVRDFVRRLDSPAAGMLLDVGHLCPGAGSPASCATTRRRCCSRSSSRSVRRCPSWPPPRCAYSPPSRRARRRSR
jgi:sugar phosphate isomerase/epimerase